MPRTSYEVCRGPTGQTDCFLHTETYYPARAIGLGVVGVAVAAAILDVVLTSRRPASGGSAGNQEEAEAPRLQFRLLPPNPSGSLGVGLQWSLCAPACSAGRSAKR
jgi:hypothetical protein